MKNKIKEIRMNLKYNKADLKVRLSMMAKYAMYKSLYFIARFIGWFVGFFNQKFKTKNS